MKKLIALAMSFILLLSMVACDSKSLGTSSPSSTPVSSGNGEFQFTDTVTICVPFTAGGAGDMAVRILQPYLEKQLGVSIVIENPDGAGGTIGTTQYLGEDANPYKILQMAPTSIVFRPLTAGTDYSYEKDIIAVSQITSAPLCLIIKDDFPIQDAKALLEEIKANPGKYSYANSGAGSISDIAFAKLLNAMGAECKSVPFSGTAEQYTAVMGGHVDFMVANVTEAASKDGVHAIINLGTNTGHAMCEGIPTAEELGYADVVTDTAFGLGYPRSMDPAVIKTLDSAVKAAMEDPDCVKAFEDAGQMMYYRNSADYDASMVQFIESTAASLETMGLLKK